MQLTNKVHIIRHNFEIKFGPGQILPRFVNSLIIFDEKITLIDSGVKESYVTLFEYIKKCGRNIADITTLLLSHSHPDHIGSAQKIKEETGCQVIAHKAEQEWFENLEQQVLQRPVPGFFSLVDQPVHIDRFAEDCQEIPYGKDCTLQIIHAPGHSKGSLNVIIPEEKIYFTADSIPLKNDIPNYDNYHDLMNSLDRIRKNIGENLILTSWTPPLTSKSEIIGLIEEGENYMHTLDKTVRKYYLPDNDKITDPCSRVIGELGLPPFFNNPIVDHAFRTHGSI